MAITYPDFPFAMAHFIRATSDTTVSKPYVQADFTAVEAMPGAVYLCSAPVLGVYQGYETEGDITTFIDGEAVGLNAFRRKFNLRCTKFTSSNPDGAAIQDYYTIQRFLLEPASRYLWVDFTEIQSYLNYGYDYHGSGKVLPVTLYGFQTEDNDEDGSKSLTIELGHRWSDR